MTLPQPLHCMMEVRDLARSIAFYEKLLGFRVVERHVYPGHVLAFMRSRRSPFELELDQPLAWGKRRQQRIRTWHIGYGVWDIAAEHARLTELGFRPEPVEAYRPNGKFMNHWFYLYDPDGYQIEFVERVGRFAAPGRRKAKVGG